MRYDLGLSHLLARGIVHLVFGLDHVDGHAHLPQGAARPTPQSVLVLPFNWRACTVTTSFAGWPEGLCRAATSRPSTPLAPPGRQGQRHRAGEGGRLVLEVEREWFVRLGPAALGVDASPDHPFPDAAHFTTQMNKCPRLFKV